MITDSGIAKEHDRNFLLDEGKLRKLVDVLDQFCRKKEPHARLEFTVYRQDDSYYVTSTVDEVLSDDNAGGKGVSALVIDLIAPTADPDEKKEPRRLSRLRFRLQRDSRIDYSISDPDRDWCFLLAEDMDAQLQRTFRPRRFAWLRRNPFMDMGVCWLIIAIPMALLGFWLYRAHPGPTPAEITQLSIDEKLTKLLTSGGYGDPGLLAISLAWVFMALMMLVAEMRPITKLFAWSDRSVFYWGDAKQAFDNYSSTMAKVKWGVIIAFLVSIAGSIVVALVVSK